MSSADKKKKSGKGTGSSSNERPTSSFDADNGRSSAGCLTKTVFFLLFASFVVVGLVVTVDYHPGQLKQAYNDHVPEEVRQYVWVASVYASDTAKVGMEKGSALLSQAKKWIKENVKGVVIGGVDVEKALFGDSEAEEKKRKEQEAKRKREEEEARKRKEQEEAKKREEQERKKREEEEAKKKKAEEEAKKKREEEERKRKEEEEAKLRKEAEARQKKEEQEKKQKEEEAKKRKEEEAKQQAEEQARKKKEEEEEAKRKKEEDEKKKSEEVKKHNEENERRKKEEELKKQQEADARRKEAEEKSKKEEEERRKQQEESRKREEEDRKRQQEEARKKEEEAKRKQEEARQKEEAERQRQAAAAAEAARAKEQAKPKEEAAAEGESSAKFENYGKLGITNSEDRTIVDLLDAGDDLVRRDPKAALAAFDAILATAPKSPRALYGRARALDRQSETERSNTLLEHAIQAFVDVLNVEPTSLVTDELFQLAGNRCVERMQFRGWNAQAVAVLKRMIGRFPNDIKLVNRLGVQYLLQGKNAAARVQFEHVLSVDAADGMAAAHLGFILKTAAEKGGADLEMGVALLAQGVDSGHEGTQEGNFYYQLGDGLRRLGRTDEADAVYRRGADKAIFLSFWQRSLYNVDGLRAAPVWTKEETGLADALSALEDNWKAIREEALAIIDQQKKKVSSVGFEKEAESLRDVGAWGQFELFRQGRRLDANCALAPVTCGLVEAIPEATTNKRGQIKFSAMAVGTHVHPHAGPTNLRLRVHLGLKVPDTSSLSSSEGTRMRVADRVLRWTEGRVIIFDDSFDHEVWHDTPTGGPDHAHPDDLDRVVLILDLWHPHLDQATRATLSPI